MCIRKLIFSTVVFALVGLSFGAHAYDGDWKRGRIYYRSVCTACHVTEAGASIAPTSMTKDEWEAYLQADRHAKAKGAVSQYVSTTYRDSIKAQNRAAAKFSDVPADELIQDIKAFVRKGAKDGDAPASCS